MNWNIRYDQQMPVGHIAMAAQQDAIDIQGRGGGGASKGGGGVQADGRATTSGWLAAF